MFADPPITPYELMILKIALAWFVVFILGTAWFRLKWSNVWAFEWHDPSTGELRTVLIRGKRADAVILRKIEGAPSSDPQKIGGYKGAETRWAAHRDEWPKWQDQIKEFMDRNPHLRYSDACRSVARQNRRNSRTIARHTANPQPGTSGQ